MNSFIKPITQKPIKFISLPSKIAYELQNKYAPENENPQNNTIIRLCQIITKSDTRPIFREKKKENLTQPDTRLKDNPVSEIFLRLNLSG